MAVILYADQTPVPYTPIVVTNVAQCNDALVTYASSEEAVTFFTELKNTFIAAIADPKDCVQCQATGKIDEDTKICPLCNGMTKTDGQYVVKVEAIGIETA